MKALSGVDRQWAGAPAVPPSTAPRTGRLHLAVGGRIGEVVSKRPSGDSCVDNRSRVPSGARHHGSSVEPNGDGPGARPADDS